MTDPSPGGGRRGRPRKFDMDAAAVTAARLFWTHGYAETSIDDLIGAMGILRGSFYAAFGSKEALFRRVLALYEVDKQAYMLDALDQPTARRVAEHLLEGTRRLIARGEGVRGIMSVVHGMNIPPADEQLRAYVAERADFWRLELIARLERAQMEGDIAPDDDARSLALLLKATSDGMLIAGAAGASDDELGGLAAVLLRLWPSE